MTSARRRGADDACRLGDDTFTHDLDARIPELVLPNRLLSRPDLVLRVRAFEKDQLTTGAQQGSCQGDERAQCTATD